MQVFVTGGSGFVGGNLVKLLVEEGYRVRTLVRSDAPPTLKDLPVELVRGDLNDRDLDRSMRGCDAVFHVAAHYSLWQRDRDLLYHNNVTGTANVLACARRAGVARTIYTSSVAAIGVRGGGQSADESYQSPIDNLVGDYKKSKFLAEREAVKAAAGQDVVIVNPSTPIGPGDIKPTPTGDIILRFLRRQMPFYLPTGLNFIDVRDVARGHLLALEKGQSGERYILGHQNLSLKELLDRLAAITGLSAPKSALPNWIPYTAAWIDENMLPLLGKTPTIPIDGVRMAGQYMYYDGSKAVRELDLPQTPLDFALRDAVDWFLAQGYVKASVRN
jgi:dihydroflavonol-4-reductase